MTEQGGDTMVDLTKDPKWVRRALAYFDCFDKDKEDKVTLDQIVIFAECMGEECKASDEEIAAMKDALRRMYSEVGFTSAGMKREDFPNNLNGFAQRERERKKRNQETLHGKLMNVVFDVMDINKDNCISFEELKIWGTTIGMPEDAAQSYLKMADTDKNGTVERDELKDIEFKFWFEPIDNKLDNLYGGNCSGN